MSYRGGRVNEDNVDAAVAQAKILRDFVSRFNFIMDFYHRLSDTCRSMCLTSNKMNSLEVGEQTCIDRCTYKYWNAHHLVSDILSGKSANEA